MKNATALEKDGDARHCREFQEFSRKPSDLLTRVEIADSTLQAGQGMHGSFSRADTLNNMAAIGPDFKAQYKDHEPVSNPDVAVTIAHLLGMQLSVGNLIGRNLREARSTVIPHLSISPRSKRQARYSSPTHGLSTVLISDASGRYFDKACFSTTTPSVQAEKCIPITFQNNPCR